MTAIPATATAAPARSAWDTLLLAATATVIVADVTVQVLAQTIIPPLAIITLAALLGLALYRWKRRVGIAVLGITALLWGAGSIGFSADHLQHPESGIDFIHATIEVTGRLTVVVAAIAAWRRSSTTWTRRMGHAALAVLVGAVGVGTAASITASGEAPQDGDVTATVAHAQFPEQMQVAAGGSLFVDNTDLFRHTFTVEGTAVDVELPSSRGVRVPIDLPPGTYDVICEVPGHEFMAGTLEVE